MTKYYGAKLQLTDKKVDRERRFRNILANSGDIMESGEIRDIKHLYVMAYDGTLIRVADLSTNPEKQTEEYAVKAQADHGELIDGELVPSIEKQFGGCKVWLEDDGLHARMYFADDNKLADHAWSISEFASYSTGIDWFPDGYYGAGYEINEPIGILREISMVLTGNDPRAKTIDTKTDKGATGAVAGDNKCKKGNTMADTKKSIDALTPDEREAMGRELMGVLDKFTTDAPESETEPTARDSKDEADDTDKTTDAETNEANEPEKTSDSKSSRTVTAPHLVIVDRKEVAKQETGATSTKDWRFSSEAKRKFADMLHEYKGLGSNFKDAWLSELKKRGATTNDGVTGLGLPVDMKQVFESAIEGTVGILKYLSHAPTKAFRANIMVATDGKAKGWKKGNTKADNEYVRKARDMYCKMIYSKLTLDAMEIYENPEMIEFRAKELAESILRGEEQAVIIGKNFAAPASDDDPDYRFYDEETGRGFRSVKADAQDTTGFGQYMATTVTAKAGENLYDTIKRASGKIKTPGKRFLVTKTGVTVDLEVAKSASGQYLFAPGTVDLNKLFRVEEIFEPEWMDEDADFDAYLVVVNAYTTIGDEAIKSRPEFKTDNNKDVLLDESPRGGALTKYMSAVAIKLNAAASGASIEDESGSK